MPQWQQPQNHTYASRQTAFTSKVRLDPPNRRKPAQEHPMPSKIIVVSPSPEVTPIAREMAPLGFETLIFDNDQPDFQSALADASYMVCYPHVPILAVQVDLYNRRRNEGCAILGSDHQRSREGLARAHAPKLLVIEYH